MGRSHNHFRLKCLTRRYGIGPARAAALLASLDAVAARLRSGRVTAGEAHAEIHRMAARAVSQ